MDNFKDLFAEAPRMGESISRNDELMEELISEVSQYLETNNISIINSALEDLKGYKSSC